MRFGICTSSENAPALKAVGWDFVEESIQSFLQGNVEDALWPRDQRIKDRPLPIIAANSMVPGSMKICGPAVDLPALETYLTRIMARGSAAGIGTMVFGSGVARNVPDGFDRKTARQQIIEFIRMAANIASRHGVCIVVEPLNRSECNILNSVPESMEYVRAVNHPNFQCLVDSYHFWVENDTLDGLAEAMPSIRHVHVADAEGRVAPGASGKSDYRPFFGVLKRHKYAGVISVESPGFKGLDESSQHALAFLRQQWEIS